MPYSDIECRRCIAMTEEWEPCGGTGEIKNLNLWEPSTCNNCGGTGRVCTNDGQYWRG
jgi:hypothetical protein